MANTRRVGGFLEGALALALLATPGLAAAQPRGGGGGGGGGGGMPATPVGVPLDKVAVGTWAEYNVQRGDSPARKLRQALVGREGGGYVLETRSQTGRGEDVLSRAVVEADPSKEGGVKKLVTQFGTGDPMEMPLNRPPGGAPGAGGPAAGGPGAGPGAEGGPGRGGGGGRMGARFIKPDPKHLLGKEKVKVAAGSFQADHYQTEGPRGGKLDYWIAKDSGPFGLVKLELDRSGGGADGDGGRLVVELAAKGKGAKPELTKPAKPFDPAVLRERFGGGGPGGGGPPPPK